jgi:hypothetical protein
MMIYEHERTTSIVSRLVSLGNILRVLLISTSILLWGIGLAVAAQSLSEGSWYVGTILGILIGYLLGLFTAAGAAIVLEWMAQILIAQGEILRRTEKEVS